MKIAIREKACTCEREREEGGGDLGSRVKGKERSLVSFVLLMHFVLWMIGLSDRFGPPHEAGRQHRSKTA